MQRGRVIGSVTSVVDLAVANGESAVDQLRDAVRGRYDPRYCSRRRIKAPSPALDDVDGRRNVGCEPRRTAT
jgi:hypothetical protein